MDKLTALKQYSGTTASAPAQQALVDGLLAGRDVFGVMPTGGGKSVCYQLPALLRPGVTLVISPLISLMKDQVAALEQAGVPAACLNSSLDTRRNGGRHGKGPRRGVQAAVHRAGAAGQPGFRALAAALTIPVVGGGRGPLHLPVGAGLPPRLPGHRRLYRRTAPGARRWRPLPPRPPPRCGRTSCGCCAWTTPVEVGHRL